MLQYPGRQKTKEMFYSPLDNFPELNGKRAKGKKKVWYVIVEIPEVKKFQEWRGNDRQKTYDDTRHVEEHKYPCRGGKQTRTD